MKSTRVKNNKRMLNPPKPVQHIEVDEKHLGRRVVLFVILLVIAVTGISLGVYFMTKTESGWAEIQPTSMAQGYAEEYSFHYYFEGRSVVKNGEYRAIVKMYGDLCYDFYLLFTPFTGKDGVHNLYYINNHPNEDIEVDPTLYKAFETVHRYQSRVIYGAPIQYYFDDACAAYEDWEAEEYDPSRNGSLRTFATATLAYCRDPDSVDVLLLGDNKIRLSVSDAYLAYAKENEIETMVDFSYLKNAFAIDYFTESLAEAGYTHGIISSYDGYCRSLEDAKELDINLFAELEDAYCLAAVETYVGRRTTVSLTSFGTGNASDSMHHQYADGKVTHVYYDMKDAKSKCCTANLVGYSRSKTCAEVALSLLPIWIADTVDETALWGLKNSDIYAVYAAGSRILHDDPRIQMVVDKGRFEAVLVE